MRKYLLSGAVIGAALGIRGLLADTRTGPRDWRLALQWTTWAAGLAVAIGTVSIAAAERRRQAAEGRSMT